MQVFLKTLVGKIDIYNVEADCTIGELKAKIQEKDDWYPHQQRLYFAGKNLDDRRTLSSYGIKDIYVLWLILSVLGGREKEKKRKRMLVKMAMSRKRFSWRRRMMKLLVAE